MAENNTIESTIAEAVKAKVQVMVVEALGDPTALVRSLVSEALALKVRNPQTYKDETVLSQIARNSIVAAAQEAMREFIKEQEPAIKAELKRRLKAEAPTIADALIGSLTTAAGSAYSLRVVFDTSKER